MPGAGRGQVRNRLANTRGAPFAMRNAHL